MAFCIYVIIHCCFDKHEYILRTGDLVTKSGRSCSAEIFRLRDIKETNAITIGKRLCDIDARLSNQ